MYSLALNTNFPCVEDEEDDEDMDDDDGMYDDYPGKYCYLRYSHCS
jgi:hypothetical protein